MAKLESNFKNMVLVLSGITMFAAVALASMYKATLDPIAQSKAAKQQNAIMAVLPAYDHLDESPIEVVNGVEISKVYKAYDKSNKFVGAAVESSSNNGFSGKIVIMVGFDKEGNIVNYSVLQQNETPGLGTKMVDWFKEIRNKQSILGKNPASANLTVSKDGGDVDAITAATISSRAFLFAVRNAYAAFLSNNTVANTEVAPETVVTDTISEINNIEMKGQDNE